MMTFQQEQYNKAKQLVADRYLSSPEGMRKVQEMQEYLEKENAMIDIGIQIMSLMSVSSRHNSRRMRAEHIGLHLAELFDLTPEQKDSLVEGIGIEKWTAPAKLVDLPDYDDDLPF